MFTSHQKPFFKRCKEWASLSKTLLPLWALTLSALLIKIELDSRADGLKIHMFSTTPTIRKFSWVKDQSSFKLQVKECLSKTQNSDPSLRCTLRIKISSLITTLKLMLRWVNSAKKKTCLVNLRTINQEYNNPYWKMVYYWTLIQILRESEKSLTPEKRNNI